EIQLVAKFDGIPKAPLSEGQEIGTLELIIPGHDIRRAYPLHIAEDVADAGFLRRLKIVPVELAGRMINAVLPIKQ
ncbi:MAG: hypothetical protein OXC91_03675, partial [Rhodobacteraceae bacterium]|nr:hypothetical protein [Paracoccaceae bacterium]